MLIYANVKPNYLDKPKNLKANLALCEFLLPEKIKILQVK